MMRTFFLAIASAALVFASAPAARAEGEHAAQHEHGAHATEGDPAAHGHAEDASGHDAHHAPTLDDVNWYYGILLEKEGVEPSLLFRPKGMPVPFLSYVLNALVLYLVIYRFAKKPVSEGLAKRKANIERGMREAAELRANAETMLAEYEEKLDNIEKEVERVRRDMREAGELERARILSEARARRERMERDARLLVEQEFAAARETLSRELVQAALRSATDTLKARVTSADNARFADEYLARLATLKGGSGPWSFA